MSENFEQYRPGFEAWFLSDAGPYGRHANPNWIRRNHDGSYVSPEVNHRWVGWAAALSSSSTSQAAVPVLLGHISGYDIDRAAKGDALYVSTALLPEPNLAFRTVPVYRLDGELGGGDALDGARVVQLAKTLTENHGKTISNMYCDGVPVGKELIAAIAASTAQEKGE